MAIATAVNGCTNRDSLVLTVEQILPKIEIGTPNILTCTNEEVTIFADNSDQADNFTINWTTNNGVFINDNQNSEINPTVNDGGIYILTITNTLTGCVETDSMEVIDNRINPSIDLVNEPEIVPLSKSKP